MFSIKGGWEKEGSRNFRRHKSSPESRKNTPLPQMLDKEVAFISSALTPSLAPSLGQSMATCSEMDGQEVRPCVKKCLYMKEQRGAREMMQMTQRAGAYGLHVGALSSIPSTTWSPKYHWG